MTINNTTGIRGSVVSLVPNWLSNRIGLNRGFTLLWVIALMGDVMMQVLFEGLNAAFPGLGTDTALPYIGQSRGLPQWPSESNADYVIRLRNWLTIWEQAGRSEQMGLQIQALLGTSPIVRIVDRSGNWVIIHADGSTTLTTDTNWDWDSISNPERVDWWSDIWIIITPSPYGTYTDLSDADWISAWGTTDGYGFGQKVPRAFVDAMNQIISNWKGAHIYVQAVIWDNTTVLFVPGNLSVSGNPDGTWGNWGWNDGIPNQIRIPSRTNEAFGQTVRYWTPRNGGE